MGHSWADKSLPLRSGIASFSASDALISFSSKMGLRVDPSAIVESPAQESKQIELDGVDFATGLVTAETKYYRTESGVEEVFELIVPTTDNYWNAYVSKSSGKVVAVNVTFLFSPTLFISRTGQSKTFGAHLMNPCPS